MNWLTLLDLVVILGGTTLGYRHSARRWHRELVAERKRSAAARADALQWQKAYRTVSPSSWQSLEEEGVQERKTWERRRPGRAVVGRRVVRQFNDQDWILRGPGG